MPAAGSATRGNPQSNRATAIQLWIIGSLVPLAFIFNGPLGRSDFSAFWVAGNQVLAGEITNIYSTVATQVYSTQLGLAQPTVFPYPPHALFLFIPFALFPYIPGYLVWNLASATFFCWAARPYMPNGLPKILSIFTPAALICIDFGQTGLIFGALWLLAFRGKWAAVAAMTFKPHLGVLSILALRGRPALIKTILLASALIVASALIFGPRLWLGFVEHSILHGERMVWMKRWLFAGVGPAMAYKLWGWVPFAAAGALILARNVNCFTVSTASFLIAPYAFHYDMPVAALGYGLLVFNHWDEMPIRHRLAVALGFLSPEIAIVGAWWVPPILLSALWTQVQYDTDTNLFRTAR